MPIIELSKTNEKGDNIKYFTDSNYFNQSDLNRLQQSFNNASKYRTTASLIVGLASYHVFNYVTTVKNIVSTKLTHKSAGTLLALGATALTYIISSFGVMGVVSRQQKRVLNNNSHPGWYEKNKVVNPERVFFELDDSKNNEISILHSGLNVNNVERMFPDFVVGNIPAKPLEPVAQHHH